MAQSEKPPSDQATSSSSSSCFKKMYPEDSEQLIPPELPLTSTSSSPSSPLTESKENDVDVVQSTHEHNHPHSHPPSLSKESEIGVTAPIQKHNHPHPPSSSRQSQSKQQQQQVDLGKEAPATKKRKVQKKKHRCWMCNKKVPLAAQFECKCGYVFCAMHRYPNAHQCDFDYKQHYQAKLAKSNKVVAPSKFNRI